MEDLYEINLLKEVDYYALLTTPFNFSKLKIKLAEIDGGDQQYNNFMQKFNQSTIDEESYQKFKDKIKLELIDKLYNIIADEINYYFVSEFKNKIIPVLHQILKQEINENLLNKIGRIAFALITKKLKDKPQMDLLELHLLEKAEELNLDIENFKVEQLKKTKHANDVYLISNTEINQNDPKTIDYYAKTFSQVERINPKYGYIDQMSFLNIRFSNTLALVPSAGSYPKMGHLLLRAL